jgi:hypothetical protein
MSYYHIRIIDGGRVAQMCVTERSFGTSELRKRIYYRGNSPDDGPIMGYTQWMLVQQPDLAFRFVSERRYAEFWTGRGVLPQAIAGEARTVEVVLHLEKRVAGEVIHVERRRFPVLASGRRDRASREFELTLIRDIVGLGSSTRPDSAGRRWATQQIERTFRWTPTTREAREIADMVSRRAKRPLLGGRALRLVYPSATRSSP